MKLLPSDALNDLPHGLTPFGTPASISTGGGDFQRLSVPENPYPPIMNIVPFGITTTEWSCLPLHKFVLAACVQLLPSCVYHTSFLYSGMATYPPIIHILLSPGV